MNKLAVLLRCEVAFLAVIVLVAVNARSVRTQTRDAQGRVANLLDRRENNDLIWKKIK